MKKLEKYSKMQMYTKSITSAFFIILNNKVPEDPTTIFDYYVGSGSYFKILNQILIPKTKK